MDLLLSENRPLRLRLGHDGAAGDGLLVQRIDIEEGVCDGIVARIVCLSARAGLPLKSFIGQPVEVRIVTDHGGVRCIRAIVVHATIGQSDGSLTAYELVAHDALRVLERRTNSRVFRSMSDLRIVECLIDEWRSRSTALAGCFGLAMLGIDDARHPAREFTHQVNESDAHFIRRLLRRSGISWFFRPTGGAVVADFQRPAPAHELVLFSDIAALTERPAGAVPFHRDIATAPADSITGITLGRDLVAGNIRRGSWDYRGPRMEEATQETPLVQGDGGDALAALLQEGWIEPPHAADSDAHHAERTLHRARHRAQAAQFLLGEGNVRDLCVGERFRITDYPLVDAQPDHLRSYAVMRLHHFAQNNLYDEPDVGVHLLAGAASQALDRDQRYRSRFTAVRTDSPVAPEWNPAQHLPQAHPVTALVVGPEGEEVHTDALGRIRIRFPGYAAEDHAHAQGAGTSGSDRDSAWVRYVSALAGSRFGADFIPRIGMEVLVHFVGGDPDKPLVVGIVHNTARMPAAWSDVGGLPGNRYVTGIKTREIGGTGYHQLRYDDTPGQISFQWGTSYAATQLNAGWLTHPRQDGRGQPRGEGLEARTDAQFALRGAQGVYLTAHGQQGAGGTMMERRPLVGLAEQLQGVARHLGDAALHHRAEDTDTRQFAQTLAQLQQWDHGTNAQPRTSGGGAAMVAIDAPAGVAVASQDHLLLGAQTHIDAASIGNTQLSAGRRLLLRAADILSAFATKGMTLVAAEGKVRVEAHQQDIELTAARRIVLTAGEEIVLQAPRIRYVAQGTQVDHGEGRIVEQTTSHHHIVTPVFSVGGSGGGGMALDLPKSRTAFDQQVVLAHSNTGEPMVHQPYRIEVEDGTVIEGTTDEHGLTEPFQSSGAFARYVVRALNKPAEGSPNR